MSEMTGIFGSEAKHLKEKGGLLDSELSIHVFGSVFFARDTRLLIRNKNICRKRALDGT